MAVLKSQDNSKPTELAKQCCIYGVLAVEIA